MATKGLSCKSEFGPDRSCIRLGVTKGWPAPHHPEEKREETVEHEGGPTDDGVQADPPV